MRAGFIQFNPVLGEIGLNVSRTINLLKKTEADLLVLPELFNTGYFFSSHEQVEALAEEVPCGATTRALEELARAKGAWIIAGLAEKSARAIFNSAVLVSPEGYEATYRKIHLFSEEKVWFRPGDLPFRVFDIGPFKIGIMICFDWLFPEAMRTLALLGADIICHPANLVLPYCQEAMKTRCLENRVFAITANRIGTENAGNRSLIYTGMSQITAPNGEVLYRAPSGSEEVKIMDIDPNQARNKKVNVFNDAIQDRRPEFYKLK